MKSRSVRRLLAVGAAGLLAPAVLTGTASATGTYPGETLSLAQDQPAVTGSAITFDAVGQQTDVEDYAGGFDLNVFAKDPSVDPTCAPSYPQEENASITDPTEQQVVIGDWQGMDDTFDVPFKLVFGQPGQVLLCAYSDWITDTAASAQMLVNVTQASTSGTTGTGSGGGTGSGTGTSTSTGTPATMAKPLTAKPRNTSRPKIKRSGKVVTCTKGSWVNAPTAFAYRWLAGGHGLAHAHSSRLTVSHSLRGRRLQCSVKATNAAGTATAGSRSLIVH